MRRERRYLKHADLPSPRLRFSLAEAVELFFQNWRQRHEEGAARRRREETPTTYGGGMADVERRNRAKLQN